LQPLLTYSLVKRRAWDWSSERWV